MKMKVLAWLLIILCAQVLSSLAHENSFTSTVNKELDNSTRLTREQDIYAANGENELEHGMGNSSKVQGGKGSYGGANIVRRPQPSKSSAVPLLKRPSFVISTLISCISFGSLLALF
ncbi:uncharacterized protein LOC132282715 [Cornus florida]|uniref:uncharacterized protein LOC132282715 n=1 Tax=Cornus florida TaxID=4283 RepID=UPI00289D6331|nr:uncharacterized protein LOC132282715 [Cornus florida]